IVIKHLIKILYCLIILSKILRTLAHPIPGIRYKIALRESSGEFIIAYFCFIILFPAIINFSSLKEQFVREIRFRIPSNEIIYQEYCFIGFSLGNIGILYSVNCIKYII